MSGLLLFVDFEKAFDSLEWDFLFKALKVFNFGPNFIRWISVLYSDVQSVVMNGGFLTNYFSISKGVRQGCPLIPYLFILAVEILALKIRQDANCRDIVLPNDQVPVVQRPDNFIQWINHYPTVSIWAKISVFPCVKANMHTLTTAKFGSVRKPWTFNVKYMYILDPE